MIEDIPDHQQLLDETDDQKYDIIFTSTNTKVELGLLEQLIDNGMKCSII